MSNVRSDPEALRSLRGALLAFAAEERDVLEAVRERIWVVQEQLEEAGRYWDSEIGRRRAAVGECLAMAAVAAGRGEGFDCSPYVYALQQAEAAKADVLEQMARLRHTVEEYRPAEDAFALYLEDDVPIAALFLVDRQAALEAFLAARIGSSQGKAKVTEERIRSAVAPTTGSVLERKEGNVGGAERRG